MAKVISKIFLIFTNVASNTDRIYLGLCRIALILLIFIPNEVLSINPLNNKPCEQPELIYGEINVWAWNIAAASLRDILPQFNEKYPNIKVNVHMNMTNVQSRFLLSLSAGVGAPDVMQLLVGETPRYTSTKRMLDLSEDAAKYEKSFVPSFWKSCVYDGKVYAIPWGSGPCAIFYKRHIFEKYEVDPNTIETWDDYIEAGLVILNKSNGKTKMFHLPTGGAPSGLAHTFEMMIQQNGGQIFDEEGRISINSTQCLQVIRLLRKMLDSHVTMNEPLFSHAHYASLKNDTVATYPIAAWWGGTIKDYAPETSGDWGVFRLPALKIGGIRTSNFGGSTLVIPDQCKFKEAAWAFVEFVLCRPEIQNRQYEKYDLIPCLLTCFNDSLYDEPDPFFGGQKVRRLFARDIQRVYPLNRNKDWQEAFGYVSQALSMWVARDMKLENEELLAKMEQKLCQRLSREKSPTSLNLHKDNSDGKKGR